MLVILKKFDILFEFAVEMRKIGTLLHYGGSGRWFEAILCWSLFFVDKTCLCGSNLTQICEWRKWVVLVRLACFLKITRNLCFSRKKIWLWAWCLRLKIEYDYIKLCLHQYIELTCEYQHDSNKALESAGKPSAWTRLKALQIAWKRFKSLASATEFYWPYLIAVAFLMYVFS